MLISMSSINFKDGVFPDRKCPPLGLHGTIFEGQKHQTSPLILTAIQPPVPTPGSPIYGRAGCARARKLHLAHRRTHLMSAEQRYAGALTRCIPD
jgi:hypothetical protein